MREDADIARDVEGWLARHERKGLLRFVIVGSVDDGKSTLIGRLLHDVDGVYDDQLAGVKRASARGAIHDGDGGDIDFSLFTDGLKAEREQGITIDVAYRYFSTPARKYILADTPGHVQYTRNMATGASTADAAVLLLDARLGVLPQSRRHAYIASLLGIRELVACVNKMDLVGWDEAVFARVRDDFAAFTARLGFREVRFVPVSARRGDNVVRRSALSPWYDGPTLLESLEALPLAEASADGPLRLPVQMVLRPNLHYRGYAGQLASGTLRPGDRVRVLPSGRETTVKALDGWRGPLDEVRAPASVTVRLDDEVDVSRGDVIVGVDAAPSTVRRAVADLVWLGERAFDPSRRLLLKHTTRTVGARIEAIVGRTDLDTLETVPADGLALNDVAVVVVSCSRALHIDPYASVRGTGAFILHDAVGNGTVAAGMFRADAPPAEPTSAGGPVTAAERASRWGHGGAVVVLPDRAAADALDRALFERGAASVVLDGESVLAAPRLAAAGLVAIAVDGVETLFSGTSMEIVRVPNDIDAVSELTARGVLR